MDHHREWSLWRRRPQSRIGSPDGGASTLTTSAPKSPRRVPTYGPASSWPNSTTRRPVSGGASVGAVVADHLQEELLRAQDVHAHDGLGEAGPARTQRAHELAVAKQGLGALRLVAPEHRPERARDARHRAHRDLEARALRGADDQAVERLVEGDLLVDGGRVRAAARGRAGAVVVEPGAGIGADALP